MRSTARRHTPMGGDSRVTAASRRRRPVSTRRTPRTPRPAQRPDAWHRTGHRALARGAQGRLGCKRMIRFEVRGEGRAAGGRTRREDRGESSATPKAEVPERSVATLPPPASVRTPGRLLPPWARTTAPCRSDGRRHAPRSPRRPARHDPCRGEPRPTRHGGQSRTRGHRQCSQPGRQTGSKRSPTPTSGQREASQHEQYTELNAKEPASIEQ